MRWFIAAIVTLLILTGIYLGSAAYALNEIASAARAGDGAAVLARTDVPAVSRSLTDQIIGAYLARIGATRKVSAMERMVANTYGASVADALVSKMLTADKLTEMLKTGRLEGSAQTPSLAGIPALGSLDTTNVLGLLGRLSLVQPVLLSIRISPTADPDSYAAIGLHFEGSGWKLAGIDLPPAIIRQMASSLPVR